MDLFLFNNQECKEQFVLSRNFYKDNEVEKFNVITDLVDDKFLPLVTIIQLFDLKQTYIIESEIYKMGDLTIEFSKMYLEKEKNKYKFIFCVNNVYGNTFDNTFNYIIDVMTNLFEEVDEKKLIDSCFLNEAILEKYNIIKTKKVKEGEKEKIIKEEEDYTDNIVSEKFPKIKLIQYLLNI